jgi:hypothetical protein
MERIFDKITGHRRFHLIALLIIAVAILIAYSNTFTASFHFDDNPTIVENPYIKNLTIENIKKLLQSTRPVVNLSLLLNYQLNGLDVVGWHIFNTLFHILNAFLVYSFVFITLNLPTMQEKFGSSSKFMALFAGLLFGIHPIQTQAVTYIISRTELLAAFFYLSTINLYIMWRLKHKKLYLAGAVLTAFLAMGSKEHAVTLPAIIFLYDYVFLSGGSLKDALSHWRSHFSIASSWLLLIYLFSAVKLEGAGFNVTKENPEITPFTYLFTQFNVIWTYIRLMFLPINQNLDYDYPIAKTLFEFPTILSFIGHILVITAAFYFYKKKDWALIPFGIFWFYITLSPTSSFVPILDVIFEHRLYLPSVGFFIAFITGYELFFRWVEKKKIQKQERESLGSSL